MRPPKLPRLSAYQKALAADVRSVWIPSGELFKPDTWIEARVLQKHYNKVAEASAGYRKKPTLRSLLRIHDAVEGFAATNPYSAAANRMANYLRNKIAKTRFTTELASFWRGIAVNKLCISRADAAWLAQLAGRAEAGRLPEYSGGARLVRHGERLLIMPVYSTVPRTEHFAPIFLEPFLASKVRLAWHTHPPRMPEAGRPSFSDLRMVKKIKIPLLTVTARAGQQQVWLSLPRGAFRVRIVE